MSKKSEKRNNLILENTIISYRAKDDTIHITSKDEDLNGEPFHITLNQSSKAENTLRKLLIKNGVIDGELAGKQLPEYVDFPEGLTTGNVSTFDLGISTKDRVIWDTANNSAHLVVFGGVGSGKTILLQNIAKQALSGKHKSYWKTTICDFRKMEWKDFEGKADNIITNGRDFLRTLHRIEKEMYTLEDQAQLLIIDEFFEDVHDLTFEEQEECKDLLRKILLLGRSKNVHVVLSAQRLMGDIEKLINYFGSEIVMGNIHSEEDSIKMIGSNIAVRTPNIHGRGLVRQWNMEPTQFQAYINNNKI